MPDQTGSSQPEIRVLLVDDEEFQLELSKLSLESTESIFKITTVLTPSEALNLLKDQQFDCVVSDYKMPGMNGIQLCAEIRKTNKLPFIIYTGRGSEEVASAAFAAGADDYVRKEQTLAHYTVLAKRIRHIIEKKKAEEGLRDSEERYKHLIKYAPTAIYEVDFLNKRFVSVNDGMCRVLGYSEAELLALSPVDILDKESGNKFLDRVRRAQVGEPIDDSVEYKVLKKDGSSIWSVLNVRFNFYEGKIVGAFVVAHDITERKIAEDKAQGLMAAVQRERDTLSALVNSIQDEVWFADTEKRFTLANPSALKEFGFTSIESGIDVGKMALSLEVYRPDGSPRPVEEAPPLRALRGEVILRQEEIIKSPVTGKLRYRSVSAAPVRDAEGKIIGSVSVVRDITESKRVEGRLRASNEELAATQIELKESKETVQEYANRLEGMVDEGTAKLHESEEQYRTLFNSIDEGFCIIEMIFDTKDNPVDYRFLEVNASFERQTGLHNAEGKLMRSLAPDHEAHWFEIYGKVAITGEPVRFTNEAKALNRWYDVYAFPVGGGKIRRVGVLFNDVTERRMLEERLRAFIDSTQDQFFLYDRDLNLLDINKAAQELFPSKSRAELIGKNITELTPGLENMERYRMYRHTLEAGEPTSIHNLTDPTRTRGRWIDLRAFKVGDGLGVVSNDVTASYLAQRKIEISEEMLRGFMESSDEGYSIYDSELRLVDLNGVALRRMPEGTRREDLIGKRITEIYPDIESSQWYPAYLEVLRTGKTYHGEGRSVTITGDLWLSASAFKVGDGLGVVSRDNTEWMRLEERLHRAEVISAVEQMGATVAHDLRGPIGQIVQATNMVKRDPSLTPRMLQIVEENAVRSLKMIADWRSSTREIEPRLIKIDLGAIIKSILEGSTLPAKLEVLTSIGDGLDSIKLDPDIMHRVIDNLVKNAVEAMPDGGKLIICAEKMADNLVVSVGDTGMGIPEESRERIFSPLYTTKAGGMGLGLTYCRRAVETMGGTIEFESKVNEGTTFTIKLPI